MGTRTRMVDNRLRKQFEIEKETIFPDFVGHEDYKYLVIGWGSTYHILREALKRINNHDIGFLHFKQIYPVHRNIEDYLKKAEKTIIVENNATSQFAKLIKQYTGYSIQHHVLQYNGLPFSVEAVESKIRNIIKG